MILPSLGVWNKDLAAEWIMAQKPDAVIGKPLPEIKNLLMQASLVLPIGENCESAFLAQGLCVRRVAYPFDFLGNVRPRAVLDALVEYREANYRILENSAFMPVIVHDAKEGRGTHWRNALGMGFGHFLNESSDESQIKEVFSKFSRRMDRLKSNLRSVSEDSYVVLLHSCSYPVEMQSAIQNLVELRKEIMANWCTADVFILTFRPRDVAEYPTFWALPGMSPMGSKENSLAVIFTDLPPHDPPEGRDYSWWSDRGPAHRASMCASMGILSDPHRFSFFPHAKKAPNVNPHDME